MVTGLKVEKPCIRVALAQEGNSGPLTRNCSVERREPEALQHQLAP
jgi:hypothetical protein